jgi:phage shock protein C
MQKEKKKNIQEAPLEDEFGISYDELEKAYTEFIHEQPEKPQSRGLMNFATITGGIMLVVVLFAFLQLLGLQIGPNVEAALQLMPLLGGLLVMILGLGWFRRRRKNKKSKTPDFIPELKVKREGSRDKKSTGTKAYTDSGYEAYAFKKQTGLYLSRRDKKMFGVCGGIAKYLGLDATLVRIAFALSAIFFYGTTFFVYILLGIVLKKEPLTPPEIYDNA